MFFPGQNNAFQGIDKSSLSVKTTDMPKFETCIEICLTLFTIRVAVLILATCCKVAECF